jgi:hypothetical protein
MHQRRIICSLIVLAIFVHALRADSQTPLTEQQNAQSYGLRVSVDEVVLTFHAADAHGLPINDLKLDELTLSDNGKPPRKILAFQSLQDLPLRAGILIDTSDSMAQDLTSDAVISTKYTQRLLHRSTDKAFILKFSALAEITQPWTSDTNALAAGIRRSATTRTSQIRGTALLNAIYRRVSTSSATSIIPELETSSSSSPTAKTTPAMPLLKTSSTHASMPTRSSTPSIPVQNPASQPAPKHSPTSPPKPADASSTFKTPITKSAPTSPRSRLTSVISTVSSIDPQTWFPTAHSTASC